MSSEADELRLVARAMERDQEAFAELIRRYQPALERILVPVVGDADRARDHAHDAILKAWKSLDSFRDGHRFSSWLFRIGVNGALSARRRERLDRRAFQEELKHRPLSYEPSEGEEDAEERAAAQERLKAAVSRLPERYRKILHLRYVEGRACQEIAEILESTPNSVSIVLHRARTRLKDELGETS